MSERAWPEAGLSICEVEGCESVAVTHGKCETHTRMVPALVHRERVGHESGHGKFGIVTRTWDRVQCHECGRWLKRLELHIIRAHGMEVDDYRDRHGLLRKQSLVSEGLEERFREKSLDRVGGEDWARFEKRRDETLPESQKVATAKSKDRPMLPKPGAGRPLEVTERLCLMCGKRFPVTGARSKTTCSKECYDRIMHLSRQEKEDLLDERARQVGWGSFWEMLESDLSTVEITRLTGANRRAVDRRRGKRR